MPVKFRKIKNLNDMTSKGLGAFPVVAENIQPAESEVSAQAVKSEMKTQTKRVSVSVGKKLTDKSETVPKIPASFYELPSAKDDALSHALDILDKPVSHKNDKLSQFLHNLKDSIFADKTWFATGKHGDVAFSLTSSDDGRQVMIDADNDLVVHAMSIDHLIFIKNKIYIDGLVDNSIGMTSMFIVPVNKSGIHGMVLAGYKSPKGDLSRIVTTLNECKSTAMNYL